MLEGCRELDLACLEREQLLPHGGRADAVLDRVHESANLALDAHKLVLIFRAWAWSRAASSRSSLFGKSGPITDHSKSVRSKRAINPSIQSRTIESAPLHFGNPVYGSMT